MQTTEWFPADVKPVHVGYYHTKVCSWSDATSMFNWWWDGTQWLFDKHGKICSGQNRPWRGLKEPA